MTEPYPRDLVGYAAAEMTGTTLHTVSRTLSQWEHAGLVESGRQRVTIRDAQALTAIAGESAND